MLNEEFSDKITLTKNNGEVFELDQRRVKIRKNQNGLMAVSYVAPIFESNDLEDFFDDFLTSEKLKMNISGTGDFTVGFRGIIEGKGKNFSQNLDHKIILLQGSPSFDPRTNGYAPGLSKFKKGYTIS